MAERKSQKLNKSPIRIKKDVMIIAVVLVFIAVYIFCECYNVTHVELQTQTAVASTVYDTIDVKALVVRDEHTINNNNNSSITVACVNDGEKIKVGGNVAMMFDSEVNARTYSAALEVQNKLDYYIDLESKSPGVATDVASIDRDIIDDVNAYVRHAASYKSGSLSESSLQLNDKLTRRQMIIGESIDFSKVKSDLQTQLSDLDISSCEPTGYMRADESGVFSSFTDGCEELFDYDKITSMDIAAFDEAVEKAAQAKKTGCFGKLITTYEWYFCCKVETSRIKGMQNGDPLTVALKDSDEVIECKIVSGAEFALGAEETVLVLRSSQMDGSIASMRLEDIEIRYKEYEGFKIPSTAVHIDKEGNKMVYALIANKVVARYGEIIYSTKDYVVFAAKSENDNSIRLYDQIITKGKGVYDGKTYT